MKTKIFAILILAGCAFAQAAKTTPPAKPDLKQPVYQDPMVLSTSLEIENKILQAEHKKDQAVLTEQEAQTEFLRLQKIFNEARDSEVSADTSIKSAIDQAYKDKGFSKDDYTFDPADFTFTAKLKPALVTPKLDGKK